MAPADKDEWFAQLDAELQRKTEAISKDREEITYQKTNINKALIQDFWNIVNRFGKINVQLNMEPSYSEFAKFEQDKFPDVWKFNPAFDLEAVGAMQIVDMTQNQGRMGDSIKVWYYSVDSTPHVRMVFVYCEGEHYYKYNGWKRIFGQFVIYDAPLGGLRHGEDARVSGRRRDGMVRVPPAEQPRDPRQPPQGQIREGRDVHRVNVIRKPLLSVHIRPARGRWTLIFSVIFRTGTFGAPMNNAIKGKRNVGTPDSSVLSVNGGIFYGKRRYRTPRQRSSPGAWK